MNYENDPFLALSTEYRALRAEYEELTRQNGILSTKRQILLAEFHALRTKHEQLKAAGGNLSTYCGELERENDDLRDKTEWWEERWAALFTKYSALLPPETEESIQARQDRFEAAYQATIKKPLTRAQRRENLRASLRKFVESRQI